MIRHICPTRGRKPWYPFLNEEPESLCRLETVDFDGLGIHFETRWVDEEVLHGIALISLQLNNITGLLVLDYGTIASELLLDNLQDFLEVELCWDTFDGGQSLAAVALLDTDVDVCGKRSVGGSRNGGGAVKYLVEWFSGLLRPRPRLAHPQRGLYLVSVDILENLGRCSCVISRQPNTRCARSRVIS